MTFNIPIGFKRAFHSFFLAIVCYGQTSVATFVKIDSTTAGSWQSVYGAEGFVVINSPVSYPSYVTVTPSGQFLYTWAGSTNDIRALQKGLLAPDRIAACWCSSNSLSVDLAFRDSNLHQVALYLVDWDNYNGGRTERIDILDGNGTLLDTRSASKFVSGEYLVWNLSGHVVIRITNTNPQSNAVISGVFFGPIGNQGLTGQPCPTTGPTLVIKLPDGSCLPVSVIGSTFTQTQILAAISGEVLDPARPPPNQKHWIFLCDQHCLVYYLHEARAIGHLAPPDQYGADGGPLCGNNLTVGQKCWIPGFDCSRPPPPNTPSGDVDPTTGLLDDCMTVGDNVKAL